MKLLSLKRHTTKQGSEMTRRAWPVQQRLGEYTGDVRIVVAAESMRTNYAVGGGHCDAEAKITAAEALLLRNSLTQSLDELAAATKRKHQGTISPAATVNTLAESARAETVPRLRTEGTPP